VKRTGVEAKRLDRAAFSIREKLARESVFHLAILGQLQGELLDPRGGCLKPAIDVAGWHLPEKPELKFQPLHADSRTVSQNAVNPAEDLSGHSTSYTCVLFIQSWSPGIEL